MNKGDRELEAIGARDSHTPEENRVKANELRGVFVTLYRPFLTVLLQQTTAYTHVDMSDTWLAG